MSSMPTGELNLKSGSGPTAKNDVDLTGAINKNKEQGGTQKPSQKETLQKELEKIIEDFFWNHRVNTNEGGKVYIKFTLNEKEGKVIDAEIDYNENNTLEKIKYDENFRDELIKRVKRIKFKPNPKGSEFEIITISISF